MKTDKNKFNITRLVEIPKDFLSKRILLELEGRELYMNASEGMIFSGDVFEAIACEQEEMRRPMFKMSKTDLEKIEELAIELSEYELIIIKHEEN